MSHLREIKFLAGLGTILIFGGILCFKAAFGKHPVTKGKGWLIVAGSVCLVAGVFLLVKSILRII